MTTPSQPVLQICSSSFGEGFVGCPHDRLQEGHRLQDTEGEGLVRRGRFRKLVGHIVHASQVREPLLPPGQVPRSWETGGEDLL